MRTTNRDRRILPLWKHSVLRIWVITGLLYPFSLYAQLNEEIGYNELVAWASSGATSLPSTSSVRAGQVEASTSSSEAIYIPNSGSAENSGKTFFIQGATPSEGNSGHAGSVAASFYGNMTSISPDVANIDLWLASDFINDFLNGTVGSSDAEVMNHSYVANPAAEEDALTFVTRFDFLSQDSAVFNVVGLNNGASSIVPAIWAENYNGISVGVSSGSHSSGDTRTSLLVAGRQKPEIVAPQSVTSWATANVSSAAALLVAKAKEVGIDRNDQPLILKSILMAGATKEELTWSNSPTRPLDDTFGAGELNIFHSYRILAAGNQSEGVVALRGWSKQTISSRATDSFQITIPPYSDQASLSVNLSWQRDVIETTRFGVASYTFQNLADLSLLLKNSQGDIISQSDSPIDNNEHIWQSELPPGDYTIEVNSADTAITGYCMAWRTEITPRHDANNTGSGVSYSSMIPSYSYRLQSSENLTDWSPILDFTSSSTGTFDFTDPAPSEQRFYRLEFFRP